MSRPSLDDARSSLIDLRTRAEAAAARVPRWMSFTLLAVLFVAAAWVSNQRLDLGWGDLGPGWLAAAVLLGVPATVLANALEYRHSAAAVGARVGLVSAARVAVVATAANLLPLPGGALVRMQALSTQGVRLRHAGATTLVVGIAWIGVALLIAGAPLSTVTPIFGATVLAAGVAVCAAAYLAAGKLPACPQPRRWFATLLMIETGSVLATALRLTCGLAALGAGVRPAEGAVLAVSGVISNSVGLIPAGLGLKEAITAGLAVVLALPAGVGFVVSVLDRVVGLVGHALLALPLLVRRAR